MNKLNILRSTEEVFNQVILVIDSLDDKQYSSSLPLIGNSTIGQHLRHVLDFYLCIIEGVERENICYDKRERKVEVEYNRELMKEKLIEVLKHIDLFVIENEISVLAQPGYRDTTEFISASTIGRELLYAFEHSIHHLALIRIGAEQYYPEIILPEEFGIAPSTVRYRKSV